MDKDGYICLTDFGLSKILEGDLKATDFAGSDVYVAPEILKKSGHD